MADFDFTDEGTNNGATGTTGNGAGGAPSEAGTTVNTGGKDNGANGGARTPEIDAADTGPKKRGRKPLPRDAAGNIIRDATSAANKGGQAGLALGAFKPNDREKIRQQIQGMHMAVSVLTGQPAFMLTTQEATALTAALCDVCDYHHMNLTDAGGPYGLYLALIITVFGIYKPRVDIILSGATVVGMDTSTIPADEGEARNRQQEKKAGMMDFSGDVAA